MSRSLKIAYAIQNAGNDLASDVGPAILIKRTLDGLHKAGHRVSILMLKGRTVREINDISRLNEFGVVPLGLTGTRPFMLLESGCRRMQRMTHIPYYALFDSARFFEACVRCVPEYELCHEYGGLFSLGAALDCQRLEMPYVLSVDADLLLESDMVGKSLRGLHAGVARWEASLTYKLARKIICVSDAAKQQLVTVWQVDPQKIVVLPNGVDISVFGQEYDPASVRADLHLGNVPVAGFVGGFQKWHGVELLVEAFARVRQSVPQARLLLVGDGPTRPAVEAMIEKLGLAHAVTITGFVPQVRVPKLLAAMDVAVIPYPQLPQELWFSPLKLYEYMAAGKAIVASRDGQVAQVIQDGYNGVLVEPGNVQELAMAITALFNNLALRNQFGQNARQQAVDQHSWEETIKKLEDIYYSVL